ncbi:unnamed protein product [Prorocentrum cordatum]|uniref:Uncharacterized protein n=1 Tax=Prorocentrum cordatum TaxID=2364126 RepID=A0ABN9X6E9_9DINO|nr:unnamed protein product [Polarella glacialis]|mmetsp:Transcript_79960/g.208526  ORF Transcript_79960/g.208526 Transcript_79960/m.208526 type:complete len:553 (-) Transcript_79960:96-1754(-)
MAHPSGHPRPASAFILVSLLVGPEKAACASLGEQLLTAARRPGDASAHGAWPPGAAPAAPAGSQAVAASVVVQASGFIEAARKSPRPEDASVVKLAEVQGDLPAPRAHSADLGVNSSADGSAASAAPAPADSEADAGAEEDNATAGPVKGHVVAKVSSSAGSGECRPDSEGASLTCCSAYTRSATRPGCRSNASWAEAKAACKAKGMELCSKAFINDGLGKGAGCPELDGTVMWTSEECVVSPLQVPAVAAASTPSPPAKEGWVYVLPHKLSASAARDRPEDSAFTYYQFEPLRVRGPQQVMEIAEIVLSNNGWQVSTSGATVSTPLGATDCNLLIDGNTSSIWTDLKLEPVTIRLPEPESVDGFGFITGSVAAHDPVRWKFRGSLDGITWTTLQHQAEDYAADVQRRELQGFVFGEQRPTSGAAARPAPAPDSTTRVPDASSYSDSLLNKTWTTADRAVTEEAAAAARRAHVESAEQKYREAVGSGPGAQQAKQERGDEPDAVQAAALSTFGVLALLLAGGVAAYCTHVRLGASAAEQPDKAHPPLPQRAD